MTMTEPKKNVRYLTLLSTLPLVAGCAINDRTPDGATKLFVEAVESHKTEEVVELLAPATKKKVLALAKLASAQTGGRQRFKPEEMLVAEMEPPLYKLGDSWEASVQKEQGDRAEVRITSADGKHSQTFRLVKVGDRWRIILPDELLEPLPQPSKRSTAGTQTP